MDNQTALGLISLCGIVAVLILLGSFLLIRIMKSSVFGIANMVLRSVTDPVVEDKTTRVVTSHAVEHSGHRDLRAQAKSVDFDAAVASHKGEAVPSVRTTPGTPTASAVPVMPPATTPTVTAFSTDSDTSQMPTIGPRQRRRLRRQQINDEDDGELFEGLLGE